MSLGSPVPRTLPHLADLPDANPLVLATLLTLFVLWALSTLRAGPGKRRRRQGRQSVADREPATGFRRPKPAWVKEEVLRLKALMPDAGCRTIALVFCLLHGRRETVGKTYVAETIRKSGEEILRLRREIKHRRPRRLPRNRIWGLDLTFLPGRRRPILAILDHGSRALLLFEELGTKSAVAILRAIVSTARRYGLPKALRTDNEASFCSLLVRAVLALLGVRHQRTTPHCPWQNGRVERLFLCFKQRMLPRLAELRQQEIEPECLQAELDAFRTWYNHARPHQHLGGLTPAEAWDGRRSLEQRRKRRARFFSEWEGLLVGYVPR